MAQQVMLRAKGLYTFQNYLSEIPTGALIKAENVVIDRDGVIESRRGFPIYGNGMGVSSETTAKQLLRYKGRVLRHFLDDLEFDNGSGTFAAFNGSFNEVETGLRIKGLEVNGNFYFTSNTGIKKISALTASDFSTAGGYITAAGGIKAIDIEGRMDYTNPGFFLEESKVAYRVVWGIRDANNNLILGAPSPRLVVTNPSTTLTGNVDLTINIPSGITTNHFYQVYRSAVKEAGSLALDEIDPEDELYLVIEDFPSSTDISNGFVSLEDITPEDFRAGGTLLYTNPISGDGILQANEQPPLAKDIALFKGSTYYANTKTRHRQTISLLSVTDFVSGTSKLAISNGDTTNIYTFRGAKEITQFTFDTKANTTDGSYFILYSANDERKYVVWFDKTGTTPAPAGGDTAGAIFIEVDITAAVTANDVASAVKTAMDAADNGDFTYSGTTSPLTITAAINGNVTNAVAGAVPPGGAFAISITQQGDGEDSALKEVLLSSADSVAAAVDETARSLVRIINKQAGEAVYAYYLSGPDDVPGQILLENRDLSDTPFFVAISDTSLADKWNPTLPVYHSISAISATNPAVVTSASHGLTSGQEVVLGQTNSTPDINGVYTVTVVDPNNFSVVVNLAAGVAGSSGIWFLTSAASDNEESPNRVYFSKNQQPEAVPIVNFLDVGPKDQPILRILALRDSLFILKTDGVYRLTGELGQTPTVTLFDSSTIILAADSAAVLNNQIYMLSTQGVAAVSDTGVSVISRPIEDQIIKLGSTAYTNFRTASWAIGYESDRAYLLSTVTNTSDDVATQLFRYNTFTSTWTRWPVSKTCGVIGGDDRLYFGAGDTNFIERERKEFSRKDFADREFTVTLPANSSVSSDGTVFQLGSVTDVEVGDMIVQTQYVTRSQFNYLLRKLDLDLLLDDADYYSLLNLAVGGNLTTKMTSLVAKLNLDDSTRVDKTFPAADVNTGGDVITLNSHGFGNNTILHFTSSGTLPGGLSVGVAYYVVNATANTFQVSLTENGTPVNLTTQGTGTHTASNKYFFSGSADFATIQTQYNHIIEQLNDSAGVSYSNYRESEGTVEHEALILAVDIILQRVTINTPPSWIQGPATSYRAIECSVQWAPQSMQDPSILKQVREGTFVFENSAFYSGAVYYRSDLSRNFEKIDFFGTGNGTWGFFPWGEVLWGGDGTTVPLRTLVPRQKQRCRYLDCKFEHQNAREKFALFGISLTYEMNSSRAYR